MRTILAAFAVLGLAACQPATPEKAAAPPADTPAEAVTSATDPNPTVVGTTTDAPPGETSGAMGSTPPTLPEPQANGLPTTAPLK
jgi:hypothetical protein